VRRTEKLLRSLSDAPSPILTSATDRRGHLHPDRFIRLPFIAITSLDEQRPENANWRTTLPGPARLQSALEARGLLDEAVRTLPPRSQELIRSYYQGGLTMREIGEHFHIKESRVSQLHKRALGCMARYLRAAGIGSVNAVWELEG